MDRWTWLPYTAARIQEAYDFCLVARSSGKEGSRPPMLNISSSVNRPLVFPTSPDTPGMGSQLFPSVPDTPASPAPVMPMTPVYSPSSPPRRGVLASDLFAGPSSESPEVTQPASVHSLVPVVDSAKTGPPAQASGSGPVLSLPFPFFPPSKGTANAPIASLPFPLSAGSVPRDRADVPISAVMASEEEEDVELEGSDDYDEARDVGSPLSSDQLDSAEEHRRISSERASGSLSSLGQPILSRYPFEFRTPIRGPRSSGTGSHPSKSSSSQMQSSTWSSHPSSSSRRHRDDSTTHTHSPDASFSASPGSPHMPPPPRHPAAAASSQTRRRRAGTVPSLRTSPVASETSLRLRTVSVTDQTFGMNHPLPPVHGTEDIAPEHDVSEEYEYEGDHSGEHEEHDEEKEDSVGLLSHGPSPKSSIAALRARASSLVSSHHRGSGSNGSRSASISSGRSRATSLLSRSRRQSSVSAGVPLPAGTPAASASASPSRSRTGSAARETSDSASRYTDARTHATESGAVSAAEEEDDHTFGLPPSFNWDDVPLRSSVATATAPATPINIATPRAAPPPHGVLRSASSRLTMESQRTESPLARPDLSEAPSSYVTAAPTMDDATTTHASDGTIRTINPWGDPYRNVM